MSGPSKYQPQHPALKWFEARLPIIGLLYDSFVAYPTPRNLNFLWTFGAILSFLLIVQIVTGVILVMHYTPDVGLAFTSVEGMMRDVNYGWLLRYAHANGSALFFLAVYIHMFRGMYYGSYKEPREVLWIIGVIIYLLMMATGFLGYVLPWGQMSYWAATVITNLFSAIPIFGETIVTWLWGGYAVGNPTLTRFFSLHYLLPFVIAAFVGLHVWALHVVGQNNPTGIEATAKDSVPFTPYATLKDLFYAVVFFLLFAWFLFYLPNYMGHADNYIPANPSVTPAHIVPEWYYLPFYAILRAIPNKLMGVIGMFSSIIVLAFLPWLDTSKVKSGRYRPLFKIFFWIWVADCILLGWLGAKPAEGLYTLAAQFLTAWYFIHFLVVLPVLGLVEKPLPVPATLEEAELKAGHGKKFGIAAIALLAALVGLSATSSTARASEQVKPEQQKWTFAGPFGHFDRAQLQRGFQVYKEVCSACHGLSLVAYRNLAEPGGPGFTVAQAAAVAAEAKIKDGPNDQGEMFERPGRLADRFPSPFANPQAAAAAFNGAVPPDLSVIAKARTYERGFPTFLFDILTQYQEQGVDYISSLLTGFEDPPADFNLPAGSNYNKYFPGHAIAMPPPLSDGLVAYTDGTPQTAQQYAKDVSAFLMWTAEPHLEARKRLGFQVMVFLLILAGLMYFTKKKVWDEVEKPAEVAKGQNPRATRV